MSPIRIAVTGNQGQVVRALALSEEPGITVIPVGRPALDLARPETIEPVLSAVAPDLIVNAAAYTAVDRAEAEPEFAAAINSVGAGFVAETARKLNVPLIQLSTDYVFDGAKEGAYTEEDRVGPLSIYGLTKFGGEESVRATTENAVILRTAWVYAPWGRNFVRTMVELARTKEEVRVVADQFGTPTYAPDLAKAILDIGRNLVDSPKETRFRGIFNFAGAGSVVSWYVVAREIFSYLGSRDLRTPKLLRISSAEYPSPVRRPANSYLSCAKLARVYGIVPARWRESLTDCLDRLTEISEMDRL